jgi:hypothetical protein
MQLQFCNVAFLIAAYYEVNGNHELSSIYETFALKNG